VELPEWAVLRPARAAHLGWAARLAAARQELPERAALEEAAVQLELRVPRVTAARLAARTPEWEARPAPPGLREWAAPQELVRRVRRAAAEWAAQGIQAQPPQ